MVAKKNKYNGYFLVDDPSFEVLYLNFFDII